MRMGYALLLLAMGQVQGQGTPVTRLVDGMEAASAWENGKLGDSSVIQSLKVVVDTLAKSGTRSLEVKLDSLDGAESPAGGSWPRQAGVQTLAIPANCVNISTAKGFSVSIRAVQDEPVGIAWLQARLFLKTGSAWLWHTTEERDGKQGMTNLFEGEWMAIERPVEDFYPSADTVPGIDFPSDLRAIGIQFFTYNGPWSGTIYVDDLKIVDSWGDPTAVRRIPIGKAVRLEGAAESHAAFRIDGRALRPGSPSQSGVRFLRAAEGRPAGRE